jgi:hypothetical protein
MLTQQEEDLLKRLSKPLKCMHDPQGIEDLGDSWKCKACNFIAPKRLKTIDGVTFFYP